MPKIRKITPQDIPAVLSMVHGLAEHHGDVATLAPAALSRDALGPHPWITLLVAQGAQGVSGYAALCPIMQLQFGARGMDMHHLYVAKDARGLGIGTALITACVNEAKRQNARFVTVGTHPDNTAAQTVYLKAGFEQRPTGGARFRMLL